MHVGFRYNLFRRPIQFTPFVAVAFPSHHYEHFAHSAVGTDLWEVQIDHPLMRGALNMAQITLACGLGMEARNPHLHWRPRHPKLCDWFAEISERPSFAATAPPRSASKW